MLWMGSWSGCDVLGVGQVGLAPFLWLAVDEDGSGSDQGDQVGTVDAAPSLLSGVAQLVGHGQGGLAAPGSLGGLGAESHGGEGRLDGIGAPKMLLGSRPGRWHGSGKAITKALSARLCLFLFVAILPLLWIRLPQQVDHYPGLTSDGTGSQPATTRLRWRRGMPRRPSQHHQTWYYATGLEPDQASAPVLTVLGRSCRATLRPTSAAA